MNRARAVAAVLLSTLFCQLAIAVPASAIERILAARCCDVDCPERPSAATTPAADRCCGIATASAADPTVRNAPIFAPVESPGLAPIVFAAPVTSTRVGPALASRARAAPLYLDQRSLQL